MTVNPKNLILKLLLAEDVLSAKDAVAACSLFDVRENSVRVALARLVAAGMLEIEDRGLYRLGPKAAGLADEVKAWRTVEKRVKQKWSGEWIAVHCGALGRTDRTALRTRERALHVLGFRELDRDLFVRPDNLVGGVEDVRARLGKLGLEREAIVFVATHFDPQREARARSSWKDEPSYAEHRARLEKWLARSKRLDLEVAARESFLIGGEAIKRLVFDPLLPEPLVDVSERRAFLETVMEFDLAGQEIWRRLRKKEVTRHAHP